MTPVSRSPLFSNRSEYSPAMAFHVNVMPRTRPHRHRGHLYQLCGVFFLPTMTSIIRLSVPLSSPVRRQVSSVWLPTPAPHPQTMLLCTHLCTSRPIFLRTSTTPLARRQIFTRFHRYDSRLPVVHRCAQTLLTSDFQRSTDNGARLPLKARRNVKNAGRRS